MEKLKEVKATFIISSGIGLLQSASIKDPSSEIADAIPSLRSLTSAAFRSADCCDEIMKVAVKFFPSFHQKLLLNRYARTACKILRGPLK
jgi:hypothetical protein